MRRLTRFLIAIGLAAFASASFADDFADTLSLFRNSSESAGFFKSSYGYAVYPTVGEGGFVVAGAHGTGRVYRTGGYVADSTITEISIGAQVGAQAYSEIIFFKDKRAYDEFAKGNFEFAADTSAVIITAGASASAGTSGVNAGAGTGPKDAGTKGTYYKGVAVFKIVKGGAMVQAAVGGQKFSYTPKK